NLEVQPLEQLLERSPPVGAVPRGDALTALQRGRLEQAAVQERQVAERLRSARALAGRLIERSEAQRLEHVALKAAPQRETLVEPVDQVARVAVEPPLCLHEVEEQHARERGEGEGVTLCAAARGGEPVGQPFERQAEGLEETRC